MSELRKDPITGSWVIVAVKRAKRPNDFISRDYLTNSIKELNVIAGGRKGNSDFAGLDFSSKADYSFDLPFHSLIKGNFSASKHCLYTFFSEQKKRILKIKESKKDIKYTAVFKNYKVKTNSSRFKHFDYNLIGLADYPPGFKKELKGALGCYRKNQTCIYCKIISQELKLNQRVAAENKNFAAILPFASKFPMEAWILPKKHSCDYSTASYSELKSLASIFEKLLTRMKILLGDFSYSYLLRTAPMDAAAKKDILSGYHWHIEITPLLTQVAGFELGAGFYINPTPPELSAGYLRKNSLPAAAAASSNGSSVACPFCPGNESMTPPETDSERLAKTKPDRPGWSVRVVPNKFPALENNLKNKKEKKGVFIKMAGVGAHEVIIETASHSRQLSGLSEEKITDVIKMYCRRFRALSKDKRFKYILIFKNHGLAAGASLEHSHTQLISLPVVPQNVKEEIESASAYFSKHKQCLFCAELKKEINQKDRVVFENSGFLAFCPSLPRSPFEVALMPKKHSSDFSQMSQKEIKNLAAALKELLKRQNCRLQDPPYNFLIHTSPVNTQKNIQESYHWHIELLPKLGEITNFERATGKYLNPVSPETAAALLSFPSGDGGY